MGTGIFTRMLTGWVRTSIIVSVPMDTHTHYTLI